MHDAKIEQIEQNDQMPVDALKLKKKVNYITKLTDFFGDYFTVPAFNAGWT